MEATPRGWCSAKTIALDRLFLPLVARVHPPPYLHHHRVAGVGKTTLVRNFVHLWARGQVGKDFSLVLPLTFRISTPTRSCLQTADSSAQPSTRWGGGPGISGAEQSPLGPGWPGRV